jgi:hypothetical protein
LPARLSAIKREVEARGFTIQPPSGGGSHWKVVRKGGCYPLPAHNGLKEEISDFYIRAMCRFLGIDFQEFRRSL